MYEVRITPEGLRHLNRLPEKIRDAALSLSADRSAKNPVSWESLWLVNLLVSTPLEGAIID